MRRKEVQMRVWDKAKMISKVRWLKRHGVKAHQKTEWCKYDSKKYYYYFVVFPQGGIPEDVLKKYLHRYCPLFN